MQDLKKYNCANFKALLRKNEKLMLILLDIDNFSNINDSYGVDFGDEIFTYVHHALQEFKCKDIDVYKLESDEFALVNKNNFDINHAINIAKTITSFFNETEVDIDEDISCKLSFSIGIALGRGITVLNNARLAIKDLRQHSRGTYKVYDMKSSYVRNVQDNVYWVNTIKDSVANDDIVAFYQPIVDNKTNEVYKYECLTRILNDGEYVSPYLFMDAANETRMLSFITKSIIKQACKTFSKNSFEFSINITNDDLHLGYLEEYLLRITKMNNIEPSRVVLELLEDISSLQAGSVIAQLNSLKRKGFKLSIDDFGSESSNFSRLLELKPDYLKIDGSFVKNIITDKRSQIITEGIVDIAHKMGIKIIAEYIHSKEVQDKIVELGVDFSQGFFHGEPSREI
jgi:diguanylate cyclase (GGDEF)-like protein